MKKNLSWLLVFVLLLSLAGLACETLAGDGGSDGGDTSTDDGGDTSTDGGSSDADMVEGLPVTSDASNVVNTNFQGVVAISYSSDMSIADVADFYRTEMGNLGYDLTTDSETAQSAALIFTGELGTVSVGIAPDPINAGKTAVAIGTTP